MHGPQSNVPPQPSLTTPQVAPWLAQVLGKHNPQTFGVPLPPQVSGLEQVPQASVPPQPSPTEPQVAPRALHVLGTQAGTPQTFGVPLPPHV